MKWFRWLERWGVREYRPMSLTILVAHLHCCHLYDNLSDSHLS